MATHQVEEYYTHISELSLTDKQKKHIEDWLCDNGYSNYEFQDNDSVLVIDDVESECSGDELEAQVFHIIDNA